MIKGEGSQTQHRQMYVSNYLTLAMATAKNIQD